MDGIIEEERKKQRREKSSEEDDDQKIEEETGKSNQHDSENSETRKPGGRLTSLKSDRQTFFTLQ